MFSFSGLLHRGGGAGRACGNENCVVPSLTQVAFEENEGNMLGGSVRNDFDLCKSFRLVVYGGSGFRGANI